MTDLPRFRVLRSDNGYTRRPFIVHDNTKSWWSIVSTHKSRDLAEKAAGRLERKAQRDTQP